MDCLIEYYAKLVPNEIVPYPTKKEAIIAKLATLERDLTTLRILYSSPYSTLKVQMP
jgi:hypothetical protein